MRVLAESPELRYLQVIFDDEDVDAFRDRLVKSGAFSGRPIVLSDGRRVGTALSGAAWPFEFTTEDGERFDGAAIMELQFDSADFMKVARAADLVLDDDRILLLGDDAGDQPPVKKSGEALLREELRAAWRLP